MPVEADQLVIINAALALIGDEKITSLSDEGEREDLANAIYEERLLEALGMARWRFATRQVTLVRNATAPVSRWDAAYDLPDGDPDPDVLGIHAVTVGGDPIAFDRYGDQIYCNAAASEAVVLDYLFRPAEADFGPRFKGGFIDALAADFALSKSGTLHDRLLKRANDKLQRAMSLEAQERTTRKLPTHRFVAGRRFWHARGSGQAASIVADPAGTGGSGAGAGLVQVPDGDYGVITITGGVWTLDGETVDLAHLADQSAGALLYWDATGTAAILAAGTNGHVLKLSGGLPVWAAEAGGGGGVPDGDYGDISITGGVWSIDAGAVTATELADDAVETAKILDDAVTLAKMAHGTAGDLLYYGASGIPALLAKGADGLFLSLVAGLPAWATAPGGVISVAPVATTSGATAGFTGLPSGIKVAILVLSGCSQNGADEFLAQLGDAGGYEVTGYDARVHNLSSGQTSTAGFILNAGAAAATAYSGFLILVRHDGNEWHGHAIIGNDSGAVQHIATGKKTLSAELDRIQLALTGAGALDAGAISLHYLL